MKFGKLSAAVYIVAAIVFIIGVFIVKNHLGRLSVEAITGYILCVVGILSFISNSVVLIVDKTAKF